jgi:toxin secretion/phage lysis holin
MTRIVFLLGVAGGVVTSLFGGWSLVLQILILFMAVDYITGLMVAGIFKKSTKSCNGGLSSNSGFKGLCRKGVTLLIVMVACQLDILLNSTIIRDITIISFIVNELISIIENAGLMGVPVPDVIRNAIDILKKKSSAMPAKAEAEIQEEDTDD